MPPKDPPPDLSKLLFGSSPPPAAGNGTPTAPPKTAGRPSRGAGKYEVHRRELLKVADEMRNDIKAVEQAVQALKIQVHEVGGWDVARQLATKVNTAHTNMLDGLNLFLRGCYSEAERIEAAAKTYGKAEEGAKAAARPATPKNVTPW
ncbi:hypothetical protein [Actinomadura verrucosospora]|uniref:Uncharacterized protein n=1 Tax=Actinomadura verrucosospora TaxID=46165 RepID=A0A7D3ZJZ3_ACTVE|nr:hypothetical protein [Actinomadura verrucosospora]QKG21741.1 hypothetical protein ACTIVE_3379 [Actinomadura verrucosospora]